MALYNLKFDDLTWRGKIGVTLVTVVGLAAIAALIILSFGLFLILLPVAAVAVLIGRWRLRKLMEQEQARQRAAQPQTIEIDYRVVNGEDRRQS
jgi:cell division protein FtsL